MDFDEIMKLMSESADSIADPSPEDYPELGREERERIYAMSEKKYNMGMDKNISNDEVEVKGVERYKRPVWHRFLSVAAAIALIAGIGGGMHLMNRSGNPGNDSISTETGNKGELTAVAKEATEKWLSFGNFCVSCQVDDSEGARRMYPYRTEAGNVTSEAYYDVVTDTRFTDIDSIKDYLDSMMTENGQKLFAGLLDKEINYVSYPDFGTSATGYKSCLSYIFVEVEGQLLRKDIGSSDEESSDGWAGDIDISDISVTDSGEETFTAKRRYSSVRMEHGPTSEFTFVFVKKDGKWLIDSVITEYISDKQLENEEIAQGLTSQYIELLNSLEQPECDMSDIITVSYDMPDMTADMFETPEEYNEWLRNNGSIKEEYARLTIFDSREALESLVSKFMDSEAAEDFKARYYCTEYKGNWAENGVISLNAGEYQNRVKTELLISVNDVLYARTDRTATSFDDKAEFLTGDGIIYARRKVNGGEEEIYPDGYMYFYIDKHDGDWKIRMTGEKAYAEYLSAAINTAVDEIKKEKASENNTPDSHDIEIVSDADMLDMARTLTDGFADIRTIAEFGLAADSDFSLESPVAEGYYYYRVTDNRFNSTDSLISYARSVLTEELEDRDGTLSLSRKCSSYEDSDPFSAIFVDKDGMLYTKAWLMSSTPAVEFKGDPQITGSERDSDGNITSFTVSRPAAYQSVTEPMIYTFNMVKTGEGWRIDGYSVSGSYEGEAARLLNGVRELRGAGLETGGEELIYTKYIGSSESLHSAGDTPGEYIVYSYYPVTGGDSALTLAQMKDKAYSVFTEDCIRNRDGIATNALDDMKLFGGDTSAYSSTYTWASEDESTSTAYPDLGYFIENNGRLYMLANGHSWVLDPGEGDITSDSNITMESMQGCVRYATNDKFDIYKNVEPSEETYGLGIITFEVVNQNGEWRISSVGLSTGAI